MQTRCCTCHKKLVNAKSPARVASASSRNICNGSMQMTLSLKAVSWGVNSPSVAASICWISMLQANSMRCAASSAGGKSNTA